MPTCFHCRNESSAAHYARIVENKTPLYGPWEGWRMSGRFLIAPGKAGRLTPERLLGMMWEELTRLRQVKNRPTCPAPAVILPARERFDGSA